MSAALAGFSGRALGSNGARIFTSSLLVLTFLISLFVFAEVCLNSAPTYIHFFSWFSTASLSLDWGFSFDGLTAIMLVVVTSISALVHIYSTEYMSGDPHIQRFMAYLSLFTFFMIILVTADNYAQVFIGWEGVGLCSYLLINFWFTRIQANKAAIKAMVVNRIGDIGFALAMFLILINFGSLDFATVFALTPIVASKGGMALTLIGLCLIIGAVGKSAQLGLHTWLPDAMEGPTPVSALIHAATMVTAGVYLIIRSSPIIESSEISLGVLTVVGALTALMAATIGLVQNDIKRVIAYSTCSQLGYMVFACGVSNYSVSLFHLMNHAFFKALLFLSAGSVIHALADEQDMRKMGGLFKALPLTYSLMLIGSLSLMGFPFLTGFYSKDAILELTYASYSIKGTFAYWLGAFSALCTSFYSFRLLLNTFIVAPRGSQANYKGAHEAPTAMMVPLIILGFGSIFVGYLMKDLVIGMGSTGLGGIASALPHHVTLINAEFLSPLTKFIPVILSTLGAGTALFIYLNYPSAPVPSRQLFIFLSNKWHFDAIYNHYIVKPLFKWGLDVSYKVLDKGLIETVGPTGIQRLLKTLTQGASQLQSGQVYNYALAVLLYTTLISLGLGENTSAETLFILPVLLVLLSGQSTKSA